MEQQEFEDLFETGMDASDFEGVVGKALQEYIDDDLTFEDGHKRQPEPGDVFDVPDDHLEWVFTTKGQNMFEKALSNAYNAMAKIYPDEDLRHYNIVSHTNIIEP